MRSKIVLISTGLFCSGCSRAPSIPLFGAFFPAWMFCAVAGIALAIAVRVLVAATGRAQEIGSPALTYPLLAVLFASIAWTVFFRG